MLLVGGFVPEKIPVCTCIEKGFIVLTAFLAKGQCHRTIRVTLFYLADDTTEHFSVIESVLPALKHKGTETIAVALATALQDLLGGKPISAHVAV